MRYTKEAEDEGENICAWTSRLRSDPPRPSMILKTYDNLNYDDITTDECR